MKLTRKVLGRELSRQLDDGYDPVKLAKWAYRVQLDARDIDPKLASELLKLVAMEQGREFEITEAELREMAKSLQFSE
jgi:hypothetical protein